MCGRVNVSDHEGLRALLAMMGMNVWPVAPPRFNVAPTANVDVVTLKDDGHSFGLECMRWGFTAKGYNDTKRLLFNARSETVFSKPSFRSSALSRRAIVPINGFYEWQATSTGSKRAFHIASANSPAMALAAIFTSHVQSPNTPVKTDTSRHHNDAQQLSLGLCFEDNDATTESFQTTDPIQTQRKASSDKQDAPKHHVCVLTMTANQQMAAVHDRMPFILDTEQAQSWLHNGDNVLLKSWYSKSETIDLRIKQVNGFVNNASNDGPECLGAALKS